MKNKIILPAIFSVVLLLSGCEPLIYTSPEAKQIMKNHKVVAILPFNVTYDLKSTEKLDMNALKQQAKNDGYFIQNQAQAFLLFKMDKYSITFQDIHKTNALLDRAGIPFDSLVFKDRTEIAKVLGVDALFSGDIRTNRIMSDAAAVVIDILTDFWAPTNRVEINSTVYNGEDGKLLWQYNYAVHGGITSSQERMTRRLMQQISWVFPYRVKS